MIDVREPPGATWQAVVPEELKDKVAALVDLTAAVQLGGRARPPAEVPDRPQTIAVVGGRGQGKSTLIGFGARALSDSGLLVLPVLDPERFADGDTLFGWVLAELERHLGEVLDWADDEGRTILRRLDDLRRAHALIAGPYAEGLAQRGVSPEEYSRDAARVPASGTAFVHDWKALVHQIAQARNQPDLQLVVPIDDADVHPSLLPSLLADADALGASRHVVTIVAFDERTLRQSLIVATLDRSPAAHALALERRLVSDRDIEQYVLRRIVKSFPRSLRIHLDGVPPDRRLEYKPVGEDAALVDLLRKFPIMEPGLDTLEDLFVVKDSDERVIGCTHYTSCLSDNRRDLRQLYEALALTPSSVEGSRLAVTYLLRHGLDAIAEVAGPDETEILQVRANPSAQTGAEISFNLLHVKFGRVVGKGSTIYRWDREGESAIAEHYVLARHVDQIYMTLYESGEDQEDEDDDGIIRDRVQGLRLPDALTHNVLFAWELWQIGRNSSLVELGSLSGAVQMPGLRNWRNQIAPSWGSTERGWCYLMVPDWESASDYFRFTFSWNKLADVLDFPDSEVPHTRVVEYLMLAHLELVLTIQDRRRVPVPLAAPQRSDVLSLVEPETWTATRTRYMEGVSALFHRCVQEARGDEDDQRNRDFLSWVTTGLPFMASRNVATPEVSDFIIELWRAADISERSRTQGARSIAEEIRATITDGRADADIELLSRIDPKLARTLMDLRTAIGQQRARDRANLLRQIREQGTPEDILMRLERDGASREDLAALSLRGLPPQVLVVVAELFPTSEDAEGDASSVSLD